MPAAIVLNLKGKQVHIFRFISAVDGSTMSPEYIEHNKIRMLPGYSDPYHDRPLKWGEIGCFMSHYKIWEVRILVN